MGPLFSDSRDSVSHSLTSFPKTSSNTACLLSIRPPSPFRTVNVAKTGTFRVIVMKGFDGVTRDDRNDAIAEQHRSALNGQGKCS